MANWHRKEDDEYSLKFEEIYEENVVRVYRYINRLVHHEVVAEDLTTEVFVTLWKKRETLLHYENVTGLLHKISKDLSINHLKSLARNREKKQEFIHHYFNTRTQKDEYAALENQLTLLEQAIDSLPDRCREVVKMKFLLDKSLKEIASELHISVNTVQNHLTRGKFLIKEWMNSEEMMMLLAVVLCRLI